MSWPTYPEYKESGVEWVGRLPTEWETVALQHLYRIVGGATPKSDVPDFWDGDITWVTPADIGIGSSFWLQDSRRRITGAGMQSCSTELLPRGTVIVACRAPIGPIGIAGRPMATNQGCKGLVGDTVESRFVAYQLSVNAATLNAIGRGTTFLELSATDLGAFRIALPPIEEQVLIADFLDRETAKIDALIAKQEQLIATLREDRTATITHAVTKGLDPDAEMTDSGVQWLGFVPACWTRQRLSGTYLESDERLGSRYAPELLSVSIHLGVRPRRELITDKEARAEDFTKYKLCRPGDIVLNRMRAFQGGLGVAYQEGMVSPDYMVMRIKPGFVSEYIGFLMKTPWFVETMTSRLRGIGGVDQGNARTPRINPRDLGNIEVVLPPLDEQRRIVESLKSRLVGVERLMAKAEDVISLLREYRAALISEVVTGKIDVRGVA